MQLNPEQEKAKQQTEWPLLILAWAWSWKTATLTARVEYMIREKGILPSSIMMVTFTNKAASEMRERVARTLGIESPKTIYTSFSFPLIWTFHSIWIFILKDVLKKFSSEELNIWLRKDFVIYDEQDKLSIIKNILKNKLNLEEKEYPAKTISFYISNAKNNMMTAAMYEAEVDSKIKEVVYSAFLEYEKTLNNNNAMDFDDILNKTYQVLQHQKILEIYQERYKYIMVDEYQDTNLVQYNIIKLLASKYQNIAVVWDDAQSIYSWRWADMRNIINFKKDYPNALSIKLEQNYRSTKTILAWANSVISNNTVWIKKNLWTDNQTWTQIEYIEAPDERLEAKIIADIIKTKYEENTPLSPLGEKVGRGGYKDNLILYRTNAQSRRLEEALISNNIPYRVIWWVKFYDRAEIKDILAYLKLIFNPQDVVSLKRIINKPTRKIGDRTIQILDNYRDNFWLNYFQIFENIQEVEELNSWAKNAILWFYKLYEELLFSSSKLVVSDLIKEILEKTNYIEYLSTWLAEEEATSKIENIDELINLATEYNWMEARESLELFLEDISLITDLDTKDDRNDYVMLMTAHTSKWLEEKRVFITWLEEWLFPNMKSMGQTAWIEEERRLMYVAMTRAREELFLSRAIERFHFWDYMRNPQSRFIWEIDSIYIKYFDMSDYVKKATNFFASWFNTKIANHDAETFSKPKIQVQNNDISEFKVGDKVIHPKFEWWIIIELNWEIASIAFEWKWVKKMNIRIAPVRKI